MLASHILKTTKMTEPNAEPTAGRGKLFVRNALMIVLFAVTCYPLEAPVSTPIALPAYDRRQLPNFHAVHSYLWRGGAPTAAGIDELQRLGVKTIIDLRRNEQRIAAEKVRAAQLGMDYVSLPMGNFVPSQNKQNRFLEIVKEAETNESKAPVFLHCSHGSDRTSFMVALWRVQHDHWSIMQAASEMLQRGFLIHKLKKEDLTQPLFD